MPRCEEVTRAVEKGARANVFRLRLLIEGRWLQASVQTDFPRLIDLLNSGRGTLAAEQVTLQGDVYSYPGDKPCAGTVRLERAIAVVPLGDEKGDAQPEATSAGIATTVRLGAGPFEVTGQIRLREGACLAALLDDEEGRFVVVRQATLRRADGGGPVERHDLLLLNRDLIDYLLPAPPLPLFDLVQGLLD